MRLLKIQSIPLLLLLLAAPALGEVRQGFSLYGHVSAAETVVLATVDPEGRVQVLDLVRGKPIPGGSLQLTNVPVRVRFGHAAEDRRALLFLSEGWLVGGGAGVAWIRDGLVELLPAHPGYISGKGYRALTVAQFLESVKIVAGHVAEVRRIAEMAPGRDRILALSRLLLTAEGECAWYVFRGNDVASLLDLGPPGPNGRNYGTRGRGYQRTYIEEVRTALLASIENWSEEERNALMDAIRDLPSGRARREHVEILQCAGVTEAFGKELTRWFLAATALREKLALARALLAADPVNGRAALLVQANLAGLDQSALTAVLLSLLASDLEDPTLHFTVRRIARDLLEAGKDPKWGELGRTLVFILTRIHDAADRGLLLRFAQSPLACRFEALTNLKAWAGKEWEAADPRWDGLLAR